MSDTKASDTDLAPEDLDNVAGGRGSFETDKGGSKLTDGAGGNHSKNIDGIAGGKGHNNA